MIKVKNKTYPVYIITKKVVIAFQNQTQCAQY